MQLPVQSFSAMVQQMAATLQGNASQLVDLTVGSVLRALLEASASVALWMQWLILQVLSTTRAATSIGPDLDSWMADFSLTRLPATSAVGTVTFSRYTPGITATILVGPTTVRVTQGLQTYSVIAQTTNPAWNGTSGYTLPNGITSVDVPVAAIMPGSAGNVVSGAIGLLASPIPGIDTVTNAMPTVGGMDAETDTAFRSRFQLYINSRSLATELAVISSIANVQQGLRYAVLENQTISGVPEFGSFCVIVDDGTGSPPTTLLSAAQVAVNAVRPVGSTFSVNGPLVMPAAVTVVLETSNPLTHANVVATVQQNIAAWISSLSIGATLAISKLEAIAHDTDLSVVSVTSTLINNSSSDLVAPDNGVIIAYSVTVR
jgi:phage-related baseplate assembly protein